jgi:hypothetical protein
MSGDFVRSSKSSEELLNELDARYFTEEFDPIAAVLSEFTESTPDSADSLLERRLNDFDLLRSLVDSRLSLAVMANHQAFLDGMTLISQVKKELAASTELCHAGRSNLTQCSTSFSHSLFRVLQKRRKAVRLQLVEARLKDVHQLIKLEVEINALLKAGDFLQAVRLYKDCLSKLAASGLSQFTCLDDLRKRFLRVGESINQRLKERMLVLCKHFDDGAFRNALNSLVSLGELQLLSDLLKKSFSLAIDETAIEALQPYLDGEAMGQEQRGKPFKEICSQVEADRFGQAFINLCAHLSDALQSQYSITLILQEKARDPALQATSLSSEAASSEQISLGSAIAFLHESRQPNWAKCQTLVNNLLSAVYLTPATVPVAAFLRVLQAGYSLISIGEQFAQANSDGLRGAIYRKSKDFVKNFHRDAIQMLKSSLEADHWKPLAMETDFSWKSLKELQFLCEDQPVKAAENSNQLAPNDEAAYRTWQRGENPFLPALTVQTEEYFQRERELRDQAAASKAAKSPIGNGPRKPSALVLSALQNSMEQSDSAIVTASSLIAAKSFGRYLSILFDLNSLASDSLSGLQEYFSYYVYILFCFFGISQHNFFLESFEKYSTLKKLLNSLRSKIEEGSFAGGGMYKEFVIEKVIAPVKVEKEKEKEKSFFSSLTSASVVKGLVKSSAADSQARQHPTLAQLNINVDLNDPGALFGLIERLIGAESLGFLVSILQANRTRIISAHPTAIDFLDTVVKVQDEFTRYMYRNVSPLVLPREAFQQKLNNCVWEIKDLQTKYNPYVDSVIQTLRASEICIKSSGGLPNFAMKRLWTETLSFLTDQLVDAYSKAIKCTTEGRGLMTLDLSALKAALEKLTGLKPLPNWSFVVDYVNAYYLQENELINWVSQHPEYKLEHVVSIATCGCGASKIKKDRQNLIAQVEVAYKLVVEKRQKEKEAERKTRKEEEEKRKQTTLAAANGSTAAPSYSSSAAPLPQRTPSVSVNSSAALSSAAAAVAAASASELLKKL